MDKDVQIKYIRGIEALRNGVPNRDAVTLLGCDQTEIENRFRHQLQRSKLAFRDGSTNEGILVAGDFGTGKSHLLEYFKHIALEENFICSKVVISKETPLYDPVKLYRAATEAAVAPGKRGNAITEAATALKFDSQHYYNFSRWAHDSPDLNSRFPATLFLFERTRNDPELSDRIIRFWAGEKMNVSEIRRPLRELHEAATYRIEKISVRDLALQRFKFAARLFVAAGYAGWVLLIDEVELISRYSVLQRAKSYAELARWMGKLEGDGFSGLTSVLTITADFEEKILVENDDLNKIPGKLSARGSEGDLLLRSQAERGMQVIKKEAVRLKPPDSLEQTYEKVRDIYQTAYRWEPEQMARLQGSTSRPMREYIKSWITGWDLKRLYKEYSPEIIAEPQPHIYKEDPYLEKETERPSDI